MHRTYETSCGFEIDEFLRRAFSLAFVSGGLAVTATLGADIANLCWGAHCVAVAEYESRWRLVSEYFPTPHRGLHNAANPKTKKR